MTPDSEDMWFLPLGGCGEIGMNFNVYGHDGKWLIIDCGLTFHEDPTDQDAPRSQRRSVQMADPAFIAERSEDIVGMIITHAHEDHIGAVQYLWPRLKCPVYTTAFTAAILQRKLSETTFGADVPVRIVESTDCIDIGPFNVEWIGMTHSVPEPHSLLIKTSVATVLHSGDWKLDNNPVVGKPYDVERCKALSKDSIDAIVCDSTNAVVDNPAHSESSLYAGLKQAVSEASGRVVITCFGSNLARIATIARIAEETNRHLGLLGRSMINMVSAGRATGLLPVKDVSIDPAHLGYLPPETVLLLATGSQGEPNTALHRLSIHKFRDMELQPGDTVIFSSRVIPGNEVRVAALIERLKTMQVQVITDETSPLPIHASGHPSATELQQMYEWAQPDVAIPVHGEAEHLEANIRVASRAGVDRQLCGRNGDLFMIAPTKAIRRQAFDVGRLTLEGSKLVPVSE